jgi:hypothetical protein
MGVNIDRTVCQSGHAVSVSVYDVSQDGHFHYVIHDWIWLKNEPYILTG